MKSVLLFTNTPAPYRLPVFQQLSQAVDLDVLFAQEEASDRLWEVSLERYTFKHTVLSHHTLRLGNATQVINPGLWSYLWRSDFDAVILGEIRQMVLSGLWTSLVAWARRRPLIVWTAITSGEASVARSDRRLQRLFDLYRRLLFRRAAAIVAYGTTTCRYLEEWGIPGEKIFVGTQVMPAEQLPPPIAGREELGVANKRVVLSVNYLLPRKGLDVLIRGFQQVADPNDVLALVGSGPEERTLRQLADGDHRILFPGYQDGPQKTAWYAAADLFVFPTLHDPWGLVVNEAMAFDLPVIATDAAGCAPDLIRDNGLVVPAGDANALGEALARLLRDEPLRRKMGKRSRIIISDYTVAAACDTFLRAVDYALEK